MNESVGTLGGMRVIVSEHVPFTDHFMMMAVQRWPRWPWQSKWKVFEVTRRVYAVLIVSSGLVNRLMQTPIGRPYWSMQEIMPQRIEKILMMHPQDWAVLKAEEQELGEKVR